MGVQTRRNVESSTTANPSKIRPVAGNPLQCEARSLLRPPPTPQSISPRDDARQWPRWTAPAPAGTLRSDALRHSPPDAAAQTAWSDLRDLGRPDSRTNTSIRDTSGEIDREYAPSLRQQCPVPAAWRDGEIPPVPRRSPRLVRGGRDTWCILRPQTGAASLLKRVARWSPATVPAHPASRKASP